MSGFPSLVQALERMEVQHAALQGQIIRASAAGTPAPGNVRQAAAEGKTALVEARSQVEWLRQQLRTAAAYAKRTGLVSDQEIRAAGLGAIWVPVGAALLALGLVAACLYAGGVAVQRISEASARDAVIVAWVNSVQAAGPGVPLPPMPNLPGMPGGSSGGILSNVSSSLGSLATLAVVGVGVWMLMQAKKNKQRRAA